MLKTNPSPQPRPTAHSKSQSKSFKAHPERSKPLKPSSPGPHEDQHSNMDDRRSSSQHAPAGRSKSGFGLSSDSRKIAQQQFSHHLDSLIKVMIDKKQKLQRSIKIFNLMQTQNSQIRCLQHNNVLTIYCQTERKSLCANCVYGFTRHRTHKLTPLKDATKQIGEDNNQLWNVINLDLKQMDEGIKITQDNTIALEQQLKIRLRAMDEEHHRKEDEMKVRYLQKKRNIELAYESLIEKSSSIEQSIEEFKFKVWEVLSKIGIGKHSQSSNFQLEVGKQVICMNMAELTPIKIRSITDRQIEKINHALSKLQDQLGR